MTNKPQIGVSSCLLGNKVRYDGEHKLQEDIFALAEKFELIPFCPEVEIGLGVPRDKITLIERQKVISCVDLNTLKVDYTAQLSALADAYIKQYPKLSGYIFKTKSPSCGLSKVKTLIDNKFEPVGKGIFAKRILSLLPQLPLIEEDQFSEFERRKEFLREVREYQH
ncbi:MAG: DUF523 domain-containing protein [Kangiellaceae bacterium]|nr:DUF523 domain-containing protein [Kangiellaceae bacterium]MCW9000062.1 DUF523 domain-containing protein [Kangiellaceae bacterium]MCW9018246.1 DUF523 domain-containing protein [Kangiellaceae bacterium]